MVQEQLQHILRSLRHRNFRLFFIGQLVSMTGTWMQGTAQMWLVYRLTGSPALLGLVGFAGQIPALFLGLFGGLAADRFDRRALLVGTQTLAMLQALVLAWLALSGHIRIPHVFLLAAGLGMVTAFDMPARQAFVVKMVGREDLPNAIALNSLLVNASRMVGPALAGLLVGLSGEGWCFLINGLSYLAVIVSLLLMRLEKNAPLPAGEGFRRQVREGLAYAGRHPEMRALLILLAVISLAGVPYMVLLSVFAGEVYRRGPQGLGWLTAAAGVGALLGALVLASRREEGGLGRLAGLSVMILGAALIGLGASRAFPAALLFVGLAGGGMMTAFASSNIRLQSLTSEAMRGRVMSLFSMTFMGMSPFGALLAGFSAQRIGAPAAAALGGAVCLAAGLLFRRYGGKPRERGSDDATERGNDGEETWMERWRDGKMERWGEA